MSTQVQDVYYAIRRLLQTGKSLAEIDAGFKHVLAQCGNAAYPYLMHASLQLLRAPLADSQREHIMWLLHASVASLAKHWEGLSLISAGISWLLYGAADQAPAISHFVYTTLARETPSPNLGVIVPLVLGCMPQAWPNSGQIVQDAIQRAITLNTEYELMAVFYFASHQAAGVRQSVLSRLPPAFLDRMAARTSRGTMDPALLVSQQMLHPDQLHLLLAMGPALSADPLLARHFFAQAPTFWKSARLGQLLFSIFTQGQRVGGMTAAQIAHHLHFPPEKVQQYERLSGAYPVLTWNATNLFVGINHANIEIFWPDLVAGLYNANVQLTPFDLVGTLLDAYAGYVLASNPTLCLCAECHAEFRATNRSDLFEIIVSDTEMTHPRLRVSLITGLVLYLQRTAQTFADKVLTTLRDLNGRSWSAMTPPEAIPQQLNAAFYACRRAFFFLSPFNGPCVEGVDGTNLDRCPFLQALDGLTGFFTRGGFPCKCARTPLRENMTEALSELDAIFAPTSLTAAANPDALIWRSRSIVRKIFLLYPWTDLSSRAILDMLLGLTRATSREQPAMHIFRGVYRDPVTRCQEQLLLTLAYTDLTILPVLLPDSKRPKVIHRNMIARCRQIVTPQDIIAKACLRAYAATLLQRFVPKHPKQAIPQALLARLAAVNSELLLCTCSLVCRLAPNFSGKVVDFCNDFQLTQEFITSWANFECACEGAIISSGRGHCNLSLWLTSMVNKHGRVFMECLLSFLIKKLLRLIKDTHPPPGTSGSDDIGNLLLPQQWELCDDFVRPYSETLKRREQANPPPITPGVFYLHLETYMSAQYPFGYSEILMRAIPDTLPAIYNACTASEYPCGTSDAMPSEAMLVTFFKMLRAYWPYFAAAYPDDQYLQELIGTVLRLLRAAVPQCLAVDENELGLYTSEPGAEAGLEPARAAAQGLFQGTISPAGYYEMVEARTCDPDPGTQHTNCCMVYFLIQALRVDTGLYERLQLEAPSMEQRASMAQVSAATLGALVASGQVRDVFLPMTYTAILELLNSSESWKHDAFWCFARYISHDDAAASPPCRNCLSERPSFCAHVLMTPYFRGLSADDIAALPPERAEIYAGLKHENLMLVDEVPMRVRLREAQLVDRTLCYDLGKLANQYRRTEVATDGLSPVIPTGLPTGYSPQPRSPLTTTHLTRQGMLDVPAQILARMPSDFQQAYKDLHTAEASFDERALGFFEQLLASRSFSPQRPDALIEQIKTHLPQKLQALVIAMVSTILFAGNLPSSDAAAIATIHDRVYASLQDHGVQERYDRMLLIYSLTALLTLLNPVSEVVRTGPPARVVECCKAVGHWLGICVFQGGRLITHENLNFITLIDFAAEQGSILGLTYFLCAFMSHSYTTLSVIPPTSGYVLVPISYLHRVLEEIQRGEIACQCPMEHVSECFTVLTSFQSEAYTFSDDPGKIGTAACVARVPALQGLFSPVETMDPIVLESGRVIDQALRPPPFDFIDPRATARQRALDEGKDPLPLSLSGAVDLADLGRRTTYRIPDELLSSEFCRGILMTVHGNRACHKTPIPFLLAFLAANPSVVDALRRAAYIAHGLPEIEEARQRATTHAQATVKALVQNSICKDGDGSVSSKDVQDLISIAVRSVSYSLIRASVHDAVCVRVRAIIDSRYEWEGETDVLVDDVVIGALVQLTAEVVIERIRLELKTRIHLLVMHMKQTQQLKFTPGANSFGDEQSCGESFISELSGSTSVPLLAPADGQGESPALEVASACWKIFSEAPFPYEPGACTLASAECTAQHAIGHLYPFVNIRDTIFSAPYGIPALPTDQPTASQRDGMFFKAEADTVFKRLFGVKLAFTAGQGRRSHASRSGFVNLLTAAHLYALYLASTLPALPHADPQPVRDALVSLYTQVASVFIAVNSQVSLLESLDGGAPMPRDRLNSTIENIFSTLRMGIQRLAASEHGALVDIHSLQVNHYVLGSIHAIRAAMGAFGLTAPVAERNTLPDTVLTLGDWLLEHVTIDGAVSLLPGVEPLQAMKDRILDIPTLGIEAVEPCCAVLDQLLAKFMETCSVVVQKHNETGISVSISADKPSDLTLIRGKLMANISEKQTGLAGQMKIGDAAKLELVRPLVQYDEHTSLACFGMSRSIPFAIYSVLLRLAHDLGNTILEARLRLLAQYRFILVLTHAILWELACSNVSVGGFWLSDLVAEAGIELVRCRILTPQGLVSLIQGTIEHVSGALNAWILSSIERNGVLTGSEQNTLSGKLSSEGGVFLVTRCQGVMDAFAKILLTLCYQNRFTYAPPPCTLEELGELYGIVAEGYVNILETVAFFKTALPPITILTQTEVPGYVERLINVSGTYTARTQSLMSEYRTYYRHLFMGPFNILCAYGFHPDHSGFIASFLSPSKDGCGMDKHTNQLLAAIEAWYGRLSETVNLALTDRPLPTSYLAGKLGTAFILEVLPTFSDLMPFQDRAGVVSAFLFDLNAIGFFFGGKLANLIFDAIMFKFLYRSASTSLTQLGNGLGSLAYYMVLGASELHFTISFTKSGLLGRFMSRLLRFATFLVSLKYGTRDKMHVFRTSRNVDLLEAELRREFGPLDQIEFLCDSANIILFRSLVVLFDGLFDPSSPLVVFRQDFVQVAAHYLHYISPEVSPVFATLFHALVTNSSFLRAALDDAPISSLCFARHTLDTALAYHGTNIRQFIVSAEGLVSSEREQGIMDCLADVQRRLGILTSGRAMHVINDNTLSSMILRSPLMCFHGTGKDPLQYNIVARPLEGLLLHPSWSRYAELVHVLLRFDWVAQEGSRQANGVPAVYGQFHKCFLRFVELLGYDYPLFLAAYRLQFLAAMDRHGYPRSRCIIMSAAPPSARPAPSTTDITIIKHLPEISYVPYVAGFHKGLDTLEEEDVTVFDTLQIPNAMIDALCGTGALMLINQLRNLSHQGGHNIETEAVCVLMEKLIACYQTHAQKSGVPNTSFIYGYAHYLCTELIGSILHQHHAFQKPERIIGYQLLRRILGKLSSNDQYVLLNALLAHAGQPSRDAYLFATTLDYLAQDLAIRKVIRNIFDELSPPLLPWTIRAIRDSPSFTQRTD
ncbi:hypothetical protein GMRT_13871 [Giardia muris]|uniref:Uncharacterized protein n=1 Tax=Giardia muris TaxID=5742 RepID=A0A4Z1SNK2_GIAMU|nr:hypothetical protein GMRT_13871 [Giardia muris]|eukprot:TNJ27362.1 hypothetical protein GMRT_13871 [Giardia muris]